MASRLSIAALLALLVLAVTVNAAPIQDEKTDISGNVKAAKITETSEPDMKPQEPASVSKPVEDEETPEETQEGAVSNEEADTPEGSGVVSKEQADEAEVEEAQAEEDEAPEEEAEEEEDKPNEEVTNYQTIETDEGNENDVEPYQGYLGDEMPEFRLTEEDAMELLRELSDPSQVALFILESDDVEGFLRSVQMLLDQGYITEGYAVFLKETVSEELEQLMILRDEQYQELQPAQPLDTEFVDEILNEGIPYIPEDYFENVDPYDDMEAYPEPDYPLFQQPYSEETMALAEVANIIADQIESGEMSAERGERIITLLSQLIPEGFWEGEEEEAAEEEEVFPEEMMAGLDEALAAGLYPLLSEDQDLGAPYRAYRTEEDEPLPGGSRHTEEEVVVDEEGRPVADIVQTETEQEGEEEEGDEDEEEEGGEELEKELMQMEPAIQDDMEEALQDIGKLTVAEGETEAEDEEQRMRDELDNSEWKDLVLLLNEGKLSEGLLKELGLSIKDVEDLTAAEDEGDSKP